MNKIYISQFYTEPGYSFKISYLLTKFIASCFNKHKLTSKLFNEKYKDYSIMFRIDTAPINKLPAPLTKGPSIFRKDKDIEYFINIPYETVMNSPNTLFTLLKIIISCIIDVLEKHSFNLDFVNGLDNFVLKIENEVRNNSKLKYIDNDFDADENKPYSSSKPIW